MTASPLQACLNRHHAHAAQSFKLDEELGTLHGMSWADFVLLNALDTAGGTLPSSELAQKLSVSRSRILMQLMPLEKIGLVARTTGEDGTRLITLRPNGRKQLREARETASGICKELLTDQGFPT